MTNGPPAGAQSDGADPDNVHQRLYSQRQRVLALSKRVYDNDVPETGDILDDLLVAEAEMVALEQAAASLGSDGVARDGRIIDISNSGAGSHEVRAAGAVALDARVDLLMAHIPTGVYHLFDLLTSPLVHFKITNTSHRPRRLRLTSFIEGYSARAIDTIELRPQATADVRQLPTLFHDRVAGVHELTAATLNVLVDDLDDDKAEIHRTVPVRLLARNYIPMHVRNDVSGEWTDLSRYFGAFVTPNAPEILAFLRTVADHHPRRRLVGYLGRTPEEDVESQVRAVFEALRETGTTYVNSIVAFNPEDGATGQRVRLPRESLVSRQANCIDGTLLVASLLEAMSMNPAIVLTPGHAFVGWERAEGVGQWDYLETTMIGGQRTFDDARTSADRDAGKREKLAVEVPSQFRRWSLAELRTRHGITPLE